MLLFHPMDFLIIIAFGLSLWAQFRVKGTFNRWSEVPIMSGITGYDAARRMLDANGLHDVPVEEHPSRLAKTDGLPNDGRIAMSRWSTNGLRLPEIPDERRRGPPLERIGRGRACMA